jgi:hypothetical protein
MWDPCLYLLKSDAQRSTHVAEFFQKQKKKVDWKGPFLLPGASKEGCFYVKQFNKSSSHSLPSSTY